MRLDPPLLLREATAADAESIGGVHAEAWQAAHRDLFEPHWLRKLAADRRALWSSLLSARENARNTVLVAVRADRVVAFLRYGPHSESLPAGEIFELYAHPSTWGSGVATSLADRAREMLREARYSRVRLWTMSGANRARHFYESYGFQKGGRTRECDYGDGRPVLELEYVLNI